MNSEIMNGPEQLKLNLDHHLMVMALKKPGVDILATLTPDDCELLHYAVAIPSESGELADAIKKAVFYRKPLNRQNVIEELGDLEFFLDATRTLLNITREETLLANMSKLAERYAGYRYTDQAAIDRKDKHV